MSTVRTAIHTQTTVHPNGQVIIAHPLFQPGQVVEVLILLPPERKVNKQSVVDVLNSAPGHQLFKTAEEVAQYLREERDSWDS